MCPGLGLEQSQQLELTPEVREGIEIMAMPVLDLRSLIYNRAMSNPFLKLDESAHLNHDFQDSRPSLAESDPYQRHSIQQAQQDTASYDSDPEETLSRTTDNKASLETVMMEQLLLDLRDPLDIAIAEQLMTGIDENGYLHMDTDIVADLLGASPDRVELVLKKLQTDCTPSGIGARTLQERLIAQLAALNENDDTTCKIIENHLERLAEGSLQQIASALRISVNEVRRSLEKIRRLDPHPAASFDCSVPMMLPEVVVIGDTGSWSIKMRKGLLPRVLLDTSYSDALDDARFDKQAVAKMRNLMREAEGFIHAVDLRKAAIIAVSAEIVERQSDFFDGGISKLHALTMLEIASATGLSESTVSRVVNSISMDTPRGIIQMRYFFHSGVGASLSQEATSSLAVKQAIQELVDAEDKRHPLSDTKIVELLNERGMNASRRTVNKYRTALGILSSSKRKAYE